MDSTTTTARMCDCGNDTVIPGTRLCKECAWAGQAYPHLFPEDHAPDGAGVDFGLQNKIDTLTFDLKVADDHITEQSAKIDALEAFYNLARKLNVTWDMWELVSHRNDNSWTDANGILHRLHEAGYEIDDPYIHDPDAAPKQTLAAEIDRLRAVNAAQSDMLKGAAAAAAQREQERVALHKLIAGVVLNLDQRSPMECMTRLMAMRREYAELCAEADHA